MELNDGEVHLWMNIDSIRPVQGDVSPANPSREFLQEVLAQYGCHGEMTTDEKGKPRCLGGSEGRGVEFNLSHTVGTTIVAVSKIPVGIDIESAMRKPRALEIAQRFFSSAETVKLVALDPVERMEYFLRLWVRKEAMTKLDGEGILLGASDAQVLDDTHGEYRGRRVWLAEFGRDLGFMGAVATWQPIQLEVKS